MSEFNWDDHPVVSPPGQPAPAGANAVGAARAFSWNDHPVVQAAPPEESLGRRFTRGALDTVLPVGGAVAAGILATPESAGLATVPAAALGYAGGKQLSRIAKHYILGDDPGATDAVGVAKQTAGDLGEGALMEAGGQVAGKALEVAAPYVKSAVGPIASKIGGKFARTAESLAENATGATGKQASKFAENAGRELLDRKLVRFGDNAAKVAERTEQAMTDATSAIDSSLKALDAKGVTASADNIVKELEAKAASLEKDPSQAGVAKKLRGIIEDITLTGRSAVPVGEAEVTKRGFNKAAGNWIDPEAGRAGKEAYLTYMKEVEKAATAADPALAAKFVEGKKTYGLLAPIEEAAAKRASTVKQSPWGGLGDLAAAGAGGAGGGYPGALAAVVAKKAIAPRMTSSAAVTMDLISKAIQKSPGLVNLSKSNPATFRAVVQSIESRFAGDVAPAAIPRAASNSTPAVDSPEPPQQNDAPPAKGPDKWAKDGIDKLKEHSGDSAKIDALKPALLADPKGKQLLIDASDLKPGSKAMSVQLERIKRYAASSKH